jgi:SSS family solute:Na+ symporter
MHLLDWIVLISFLLFVVAYGVWKTRGKKDMNGYFLANKSTSWYGVMISIMATQASAITFLSMPGQAYVDGMRFVQFYFGLPIAMVVLSVTAVPLFHRLKVFTAYEYLGKRFDQKNRALGSLLFLIQRGLAAGFTILAPALIISVILGWDFRLTIFMIGGLVVLYTAVGGTEAVSKTHLLQMMIVTAGMGAAFFMILHRLPSDISFSSAVHLAGKLGKLNVVSFAFNWTDRYNFWSGLIGGGFVALAYFGTDQSQVQRYLTGRSVAQSRMGLLANGIVKVPMQFIILFIGAMVFVFYQFVAPPLFFNPVETARIKNSSYAGAYGRLEADYERLNDEKQNQLRRVLTALQQGKDKDVAGAMEELRATKESESGIRREAIELIKSNNPLAETNDTNYIFLAFVTRFLPAGVVGLILAAILSASMSASSAELNALASVTVVDIYKRIVKRDASERHYVHVSKAATVFWGLYAIGFAQFANHLGSLIEAVNIMGSLFYGTMLGIFLIAFYFKKTGGNATFIAAIVAELTVLACYFFTKIPYLWFNVIGCVLLVILANVLNLLLPGGHTTPSEWDPSVGPAV